MFQEKPLEAPQEEVKMISPTHESYDNPLSLLASRVWALVLAVFILIVGLLLWSFFGSIAITVRGRGVLLNEGGFLQVESGKDGLIRTVFVRAGESVEVGTPLLELYSSSEEVKLASAEIREKTLSHDLEKLILQIQKEEEARKKALKGEIASKSFGLDQMVQELPALRSESESARRLYKEGLVSATMVRNVEEGLTNRLVAIENLHAEIQALESELVRQPRQEELQAKKIEWLMIKQELDLLRLSQKENTVLADRAGRVLEIAVSRGDIVHPGTPLIWLEKTPQNNEEKQRVIYGIVPVEEGKNIVVGDRVLLEMAGISAQEYGYILGKVITIAEYPTSPQQLTADLANEALVKYLFKDGAGSINIMIQPELDETTENGFRWSGGQGPPRAILNGSVATFQITTEKITPIEYWLPIWRLRRGGG